MTFSSFLWHAVTEHVRLNAKRSCLVVLKTTCTHNPGSALVETPNHREFGPWHNPARQARLCYSSLISQVATSCIPNEDANIATRHPEPGLFASTGMLSCTADHVTYKGGYENGELRVLQVYCIGEKLRRVNSRKLRQLAFCAKWTLQTWRGVRWDQWLERRRALKPRDRHLESKDFKSQITRQCAYMTTYEPQRQKCWRGAKLKHVFIWMHVVRE